MTAQPGRPSPLPPRHRALGALWLAETRPRDPEPALQDTLQLVHLYAERGLPKFEPAARRWLVRYLSEGTPGLEDVAKVTASLAARDRS